MILYAVNIHVSGGKVILDQLLSDPKAEITHVFTDERYTLPTDLAPSIKILPIKASFLERFKAELKLRALSQKYPGEEVLSITNMPPLFRMHGKTTLFLQNALLLPGQLKYCQSLKHLLRTSLESLILRFFYRNADQIEVQTLWMKTGLESFYKGQVILKPIKPVLPAPNISIEKQYDFITVTSSIGYKNLDFLLKNWRDAKELKTKKLLIISDPLTKAQEYLVQILKQESYSITVKNNVSREEIYRLYQESRALIMTSSIESYGLPLYEAHHFNVRIIAPNLPYVQDADVPHTSYEHLNTESFIKAVRTFL